MGKWTCVLVATVLAVMTPCRAGLYRIYCPQNPEDGNFSQGQQWQRVMKGLQNSSDETLRVGNNSFANGPNRSLLRFSLGAIASEAVIHRATLRLDGYGAWDTGAMDLRVHRIVAPWTGMVTWNTQPAIDPVAARRSWYYGDGGDYYDVDVDMTSVVNAWFTGAWDNYGLLLRGFDDNTSTSAPGGWSVRRGVAATRPLLEVVATHPSMNETYQAVDCAADIAVYSADPCAVGVDLRVGAFSGGSAWTYLRFDGIDVPPGNYVKVAYLHLKGHLDAGSGAAQPVTVYACQGDDNWIERPGAPRSMTWHRRANLAPAGAVPLGGFTWQHGDGQDHWSEAIVLSGAELAQAVVDNGSLTLLLRIDAAGQTASYRLASWRDRSAALVQNLNPFGHYGAWLEVITAAPPACGDLDHPAPPGDLTGDCKTDLLDLAVLAANWLQPSP